ncbi:hypothetical protein MRX96_005230 [Rhipicephalus microplus]
MLLASTSRCRRHDRAQVWEVRHRGEACSTSYVRARLVAARRQLPARRPTSEGAQARVLGSGSEPADPSGSTRSARAALSGGRDGSHESYMEPSAASQHFRPPSRKVAWGKAGRSMQFCAHNNESHRTDYGGNEFKALPRLAVYSCPRQGGVRASCCCGGQCAAGFIDHAIPPE